MGRSVLFIGYGMEGHFLRPYGYQRVVQGSAASLALRGHEVAYLELMWGKGRPLDEHVGLLAEGRELGIRLIRAILRRHTAKGGLSFYVDSARVRLGEQLKKVLVEFGPDYVVCEERIPWFTARDVVRLTGARLVFRAHIIELLEAPCRGLRGLGKATWPYTMTFYTASLARASDWALTLAFQDERELRKLLVRRVSTVEPTYAPIANHASRDEVRHLVEEHPAFFITYEPRRLHVRLARALPGVDFLIIGVSQEALTRALGLPREKVPDNMMALGRVYEPDLAMLFERAMALLIPQKCFSGFCIRLIEGLAYGTPMLTTRDVAGKVRGLVDGVHLLVEDDYRRWPDLLARLAEDEELRIELGENAREFYQRRLRPQVHGRRIEAIFDIIGRGS